MIQCAMFSPYKYFPLPNLPPRQSSAFAGPPVRLQFQDAGQMWGRSSVPRRSHPRGRPVFPLEAVRRWLVARTQRRNGSAYRLCGGSVLSHWGLADLGINDHLPTHSPFL